MRARLNLLFGKLPFDVRNLEIVGTLPQRFEERDWAIVWPGSGAVRWDDGRIETETIWFKENLEQCGDFHSKWSWFPCKQRGRFFNLSLFWSSGYYHWICDVLTRLHTNLSRLTPDIQVILPTRMTPWQSRSLELLGLPHSQWLPYTGKRPWKVEHLIYASPVAMTGDHESHSLYNLRDLMWHKCLGGAPTSKGWRKLYLARKNAWSRNVSNEAELLPALLKRGFEAVDCAELTFEEQVRLFSEASCVAGPHGAAFTNILWSPPGLQVFEIFEPTAVRRCYWSMCRSLGHHHLCGIGQSVTQVLREPNIQIPVEEFLEGLEGF